MAYGLSTNCDRIWKNPASTHTKSNIWLYQKWIAGLILYHIPLCALLRNHKSGFCGSLSRTLSNALALLAGRGSLGLVLRGLGLAMKGWLMPFIFDLECCEHKEGPLRPQMGPLAFICLRTPIYALILSSPTSHPYHLQYHYSHDKSFPSQLKFLVLESYLLTQF